MPQISIIVPVYNVEKYLPRCIDSILSQSFADFELLLIDDGSPDNCGRICDDYSEKDGRIRVFHKENGGVSSARNIGLENALGNFVTFVDSDDFIHPRYLELLIDNIGDSDIISCQFIKISGDFFGFQDLEPNIKKRNADILEAKIAMNPFRAVWGRLYLSSIARSIRFDNDIKGAEDALYLYSYYCLCNNAAFIDAPLYCYCLRETSAVASIGLRGLQDRASVADIIYESECALYGENNKDRRVKNHLMSLAIEAFYSYKDSEDPVGYKRFGRIIRINLLKIVSPAFRHLSFYEKMILLYNICFIRMD